MVRARNRSPRAAASALASSLALALAGCAGDGGPPGDTTAGPSAGPATSVGPDSSSSASTDQDTTLASTSVATTEGPGPGSDSSGTSGTTDGSTSSQTTTRPVTTTLDTCTVGAIVCEGDVALICEDDEWIEHDVCPELCVDDYGCVECVPGTSECEGDVVVYCDGGTEVAQEPCDSVMGLSCEGGACVGPCSATSLAPDHRGCDFYPTVTASIVAENFSFGVTVVNTSTTEFADVLFTRGANLVKAGTIEPGGAEFFSLPWITALKSEIGVTSSLVAEDGAYRMRSDIPVWVYQHNPRDHAQGEELAYTADSSILPPTHVWGDDYRVAARNSWWHEIGLVAVPGFYAVTAREDGTVVTLTPSPSGGMVLAGAGVAANGVGAVTLDAGDVLEVFSAGTESNPSPADLTGSRISASKPVQLIGGHMCTFIPYNVAACDHVEDTIPPLLAVDDTYIVAAPAGSLREIKARARVVRVIATEPGTTLSYTPPIGGAPTSIPEAGGYIELAPTSADFMIEASSPVLVAQYMVGKGFELGGGDPSMAMATGLGQYRTGYTFVAPTSFPKNYATIIAHKDADVQLDDVVVNNFILVPGTNYAVARVVLADEVGGRHELVSTLPVDVSVYGYAPETSYWYPAGPNLKPL